MRYHGSKYRLAEFIQGFFPRHHTYVEPFGGGAGVLINKLRSKSEVYNDADGDIVNFFRVLQNKNDSAELMRLLAVTPYARNEFDLACKAGHQECNNVVERARRTLIRAQMAFGSAGATEGGAGFRTDTARSSTPAQLWAAYPPFVEQFRVRLQGVVIENRAALDVIAAHDRPDTLFFCDPPYLHGTRSTTRAYRHEMTEADHIALLDALKSADGMVVLSTYENPIYTAHLKGWERHQSYASISGRLGSIRKIETLYLNPACAAQQYNPDFFSQQQPLNGGRR